MEIQTEVKNAIKELPIGERVAAIALKNIYDQIKGLCNQEQNQVSQTHIQFLKKFHILEEQGKKLEKNDLPDMQKYMLPEEGEEMEKTLANPAAIADYWLAAFKNSMVAPLLKECDEAILTSIQNISTNITVDVIELQFKFKDNQYFKGCQIARHMVLTTGQVTKFTGDKVTFLKELTEGLFFILLNDCTNIELVQNILEPITEITNEIVPFSLRYYLGEVVDDDDEEDEDDEDNEQDEKQFEPKPEKRVKPN